MDHEIVARRLSKPMRAVLLSHIDALSAYFAVPLHANLPTAQTKRALIALGLLRRTYGTRTWISDDGRLVLSYMLGSWCDVLARDDAMIAHLPFRDGDLPPRLNPERFPGVEHEWEPRKRSGTLAKPANVDAPKSVNGSLQTP